MKYDVIVIGGGHNGLVTAAYLARAGRSVLVLEQHDSPGGAAITAQEFQDFKYSVFSYAVSLLSPKIIDDLDLHNRGLHILPLDTTFTPLPNDNYLIRSTDPDKTHVEISRHSTRDAAIYPKFMDMMARMAKVVKPLLTITPPNPWSARWREKLDILRISKHLYSLGPKDFHIFVKLMTMSAADFLDDWFESEPLKATLASSGIIGTFLGPRSPGTAYVMLHHYMGEIDGKYRTWGIPKGGMGAVSSTIAKAAKEYGAEIRCSSPVQQIVCRNGTVSGVILADGSSISARCVASSLDPQRTFLHLVSNSDLSDEFIKDISSYKTRGSSGKVNLALNSLPVFKCLPDPGDHLQGAISISPSIDYLERAYDEAKYGHYSSKPYLDILIPSTLDPEIAPPGKHVMSIFVQYVPYDLKDGWDAISRDNFGDTVISTLEQYVPDLRNIILHKQILTPLDIERKLGITQGNIFHGELSPHQLFSMRPTLGYGNYKTPIQGLFMCGSGSHPGGGVSGYPGHNAAREILAYA